LIANPLLPTKDKVPVDAIDPVLVTAAEVAVIVLPEVMFPLFVNTPGEVMEIVPVPPVETVPLFDTVNVDVREMLPVPGVVSDPPLLSMDDPEIVIAPAPVVDTLPVLDTVLDAVNDKLRPPVSASVPVLLNVPVDKVRSVVAVESVNVPLLLNDVVVTVEEPTPTMLLAESEPLLVRLLIPKVTSAVVLILPAFDIVVPETVIARVPAAREPELVKLDALIVTSAVGAIVPKFNKSGVVRFTVPAKVPDIEIVPLTFKAMLLLAVTLEGMVIAE
jgi:hypothetical protein